MQEDHYYPFGMNMHGLSSSASLAKPNAYKFNSGTELTKDFGWQMYDTPFRSYDAQLGRFHQIDPLADLAPGINPYRFGFNNPISLNDPTGLYEGSIQDIFNEAWARTSGDVGYFTFNNGSLNRDTSTENDINWVVDFVTSGQGTAEFMMDSGGGGFWLHYNPSFVGGYVGSRNEHVGAIIQKRSLFFRLGAQSGGGNLGGDSNGYVLLRDRLKPQPKEVTGTPELALWFTPGGGGGKLGLKALNWLRGKKAVDVAKGVANLIPEGKLANHLFKGVGKLADNPANRTLIQNISNGKPLVVDAFRKSWYRGVDAAGNGIYSYTQNGIVKGAGYTNLSATDLILKYTPK